MSDQSLLAPTPVVPAPAPTSTSTLEPPAPNFCRPESPAVLNWLNDHTPDPREVVPVHHISRRNGVPNPSPQRTYDAETEMKSREQMIASGKEIPNEEPLTDEDDLNIQYSRTLVCNAPKALLWKTMMSKIKSPNCDNPCGMRNVNIMCEGGDYIYREFDVGGPGEEVIHVREKVTWDEQDESVRFSLYEDEFKEGYIETAMSTDASSHLCLTVSCNWTFKVHPDLTREKLKKMRERLRYGIDAACANHVRSVEEEARLAAQERRRRNSLTATKDSEIEKAILNASIEKERTEKKSQDTYVARPTSAAKAAVSSSSPVAQMRQIQISERK